MARFADRAAAGTELAVALGEAVKHDPVVLAIPRGGVPVAANVARHLGVPLDVLDVHEVTGHRADIGLGAVNSAGDDSVRRSTATAVGVNEGELEANLREQRGKLRDVIAQVRAIGPQVPLTSRTAVVVDDGLAVTAAATAAAADVRARGAAEAVLAVPVGAAALLDDLRPLYDRVITLETATDHLDLADWYDEFDPVSDDDAVEMVRSLLS